MPLPTIRCRFRLRTLFLVTALSAVVCGVLRSQIVGRLQTEVDSGDICFRTGSSPAVSFVCRSPQDAQRLAQSFNRDQFLATAIQHARKKFADGEHALADTTLSTGTKNNLFFVWYDFPLWGRYHFDLSRFRYTLDTHDPEALLRNTAICESFAAAGDSIVLEQPLILRREPYP